MQRWLRFVQHMIRLRLNFNHGTKGGRITLEEYLSKARIEWHGIELGKPDWSNDSHSVAFTLHSFVGSQVRYIAINAYWKPLEFELPPVTGELGCRLASPDRHFAAVSGRHIWKRRQRSPVAASTYLVNPRSIVMLHYDDGLHRRRSGIDRDAGRSMRPGSRKIKEPGILSFHN